MEKEVKALFQIFLIITSIFSVYSLGQIDFVQAASGSDVCCEITSDGNSCIFTDEDNCNSDYATSSSQCSDASFCAVGCCIGKDSCSKNVGKASCDLNGGKWEINPSCNNIQECNAGCCLLNDQAFYTSKNDCKVKTDKVTNAKLDFKALSDKSCYALNKEDSGCCVQGTSEGNSCKYVSQKSQCITSLDTKKGTGFFPQFCSSLSQCNKECKSKDHKVCYDDDVYWVDSCGNRESKANDCDYKDGTVCSNKKLECVSVDCSVTTNFTTTTHDPNMGGPRKNGESWCVYESPVGQGLDRPGSRHYRALCIKGEEIIEPCRDFREEVCIQSNNTKKSGAKCVDNTGKKDLNHNLTSVPLGFRFWESSSKKGGSLARTCTQAEQTCPVVFIKEGYSLFFDWDIPRNESGDGVGNGPCMNISFGDQAADFCKLQGDCGADFNVLGEYTDEGFSVNLKGNLDGVKGDYNQKNVESDFVEGVVRAGFNLDDYFGFSKKPSLDIIDHWNKTGGVFGGLLAISDGFDYSLEEIDLDTIGKATRLAVGAKILPFLVSFYQIGIITTLQATWAFYSTFVIQVFSGNFAGAFSAASGAYGAVITSYSSGGITSVSVTAGTTSNVAGMESVVTSGGEIMAAPTMNLLSSFLFWFAIVLIVISIIRLAGVDFYVPVLDEIMELIGKAFTGSPQTKEVEVSTECKPWVAPATNATSCIQCGNFTGKYLGCTEYQCRSLGQNCRFLDDNEGTDRLSCINIHQNDANSPKISAWKDNITKGYSAKENARGYEVVPTVEPFIKLSLGIETNEVSQCKYTTNSSIKFENMDEYFGDNFFEKRHSLLVRTNPGDVNKVYVKCKDGAGNSNDADYLIQFNVKQGPDFTPPLIEGSNLEDGYSTKYNVSFFPVTFFLNEPSQCKWEISDVDYDVMNNSLSCSTTQDSNNFYDCGATFKLNPGGNKYYLKCKDEAGNVNFDSYTFSLNAADQLTIISKSPFGDVFFNDLTLSLTTAGGDNSGISTCSFKQNNIFVDFVNTNGVFHSQPLTLDFGNYNFEVQCIDDVGDVVKDVVDFKITQDLNAPKLTSIFTTGSTLHFSLDEIAKCEYEENEFNFGQGNLINENTKDFSFSIVKENEYFISCEDIFNNKLSFSTIP